MDENKMIDLEKPGGGERDALTEVLRQGARRMLTQTVEAEVDAFLAAHRDIRDEGAAPQSRPGIIPPPFCHPVVHFCH